MPDFINLYEEEAKKVKREKKPIPIYVWFLIPLVIAVVAIIIFYVKILESDFSGSVRLIDVLKSTLLAIVAISLVEGIYIAYLYWHIKEHRDKMQARHNVLTSENARLTNQLTRTQSQLEKEEKRAERAESAKKDFLFSMSHDIRTPMNAIMGFTRLASEVEANPEKTKDYLRKVNSAAEGLLSMVNTVLDMARIEDGTIIPVEIPVDVSHAMEKLMANFEGEAKEKGVKVTTFAKIDNPYIYEDEGKDAQISINILSNAIKFTEPGGRVDVSLIQYPGDNENECILEFKCVDTGIGMSQEFLEHAFDRFARENSSTESKVQGAGIGLEIVKKLVELRGGVIDVQSEKGFGTTVTIRTHHKYATEELVREYEIKEQQYDDQALKGYKILLAEDNVLNLEIAMEVLKAEGAYVETAENGERVLELVEERGPGYFDLILMDIQMPLMDGYTAARKIRAMENPRIANIPIIALTANALEEDKQDAINAGMTAHLSKPIVLADMVKTIHEAMDE